MALPPVDPPPRPPRQPPAAAPGAPAAQRLHFDAALQRAGRRGALDDDAAPLAALAALAPPPLQAAEAPAAWAPLALPPADAVTRQLQAQNLPADTAPAGHWQVELPSAAVEVQRGAAGGLHVVLAAAPTAWRTAPLNALRDRLAARGAELRTRNHAPSPEDER